MAVVPEPPRHVARVAAPTVTSATPEVFEPHKLSPPETATRIRERMAGQSDRAIIAGIVTASSAAPLKRAPSGSKHFASMPHRNTPECLDQLRDSDASQSTWPAFEWRVLSVGRTTQVSRTRWSRSERAPDPHCLLVPRRAPLRTEQLPSADRRAGRCQAVRQAAFATRSRLAFRITACSVIEPRPTLTSRPGVRVIDPAAACGTQGNARGSAPPVAGGLHLVIVPQRQSHVGPGRQHPQRVGAKPLVMLDEAFELGG